MLEPPAFWYGNGRVSTRYGPRVPHARGTAMYPERRQRWLDLAQDYERQADQLEAMEATTQKDQPRFFRSGEWDRVSPGAASSPPGPRCKRDAEKDSPSHLWATGANVFAIGIYAARP